MRVIYSKIKSIITGWYRFLFRKKSAMAAERIEICKTCDKRRGYFCGVCWCELDALAELFPEEGGVCKHPKANKWVGMHLRHQPKEFDKWSQIE